VGSLPGIRWGFARASAAGTIPVPFLVTPEPTWQTEYIIASEGSRYVHLTYSNEITIARMMAQ
jgi:hypothetical protein